MPENSPKGLKSLSDQDLKMWSWRLQGHKFSFGGDGFLFPPDFMFELTSGEYDGLRCQIGTLKRGEHSKYLPMAFTEQGVAMLSSVLNSKPAIEVNVLRGLQDHNLW